MGWLWGELSNDNTSNVINFSYFLVFVQMATFISVVSIKAEKIPNWDLGSTATGAIYGADRNTKKYIRIFERSFANHADPI